MSHTKVFCTLSQRNSMNGNYIQGDHIYNTNSATIFNAVALLKLSDMDIFYIKVWIFIINLNSKDLFPVYIYFSVKVVYLLYKRSVFKSRLYHSSAKIEITLSIRSPFYIVNLHCNYQAPLTITISRTSCIDY